MNVFGNPTPGQDSLVLAKQKRSPRDASTRMKGPAEEADHVPLRNAVKIEHRRILLCFLLPFCLALSKGSTENDSP